MPPAINTRSPSPIARVADAARELGWSLRHLAEHLFGKVGHRIGARYCAYRIRAAKADVRNLEQMLDWAERDLLTIPEAIESHEQYIAGLRARMDQHKALS